MSKRDKPGEVRIAASDLPPLTAAQRERLERLAALPDDQIDYSDIPRLTAEQIRTAVPGALFRPRKTQVTVRVDADVLAWLQQDGRGYQSRLNAILRQAMLRQRDEAAEAPAAT